MATFEGDPELLKSALEGYSVYQLNGKWFIRKKGMYSSSPKVEKTAIEIAYARREINIREVAWYWEDIISRGMRSVLPGLRTKAIEGNLTTSLRYGIEDMGARGQDQDLHLRDLDMELFSFNRCQDSPVSKRFYPRISIERVKGKKTWHISTDYSGCKHFGKGFNGRLYFNLSLVIIPVPPIPGRKGILSYDGLTDVCSVRPILWNSGYLGVKDSPSENVLPSCEISFPRENEKELEGISFIAMGVLQYFKKNHVGIVGMNPEYDVRGVGPFGNGECFEILGVW